MKRPMILVQLFIGWLPVWALFVLILLSGHPGIGVGHAVWISFRNVVAAALLAVWVHRLAVQRPWPSRFSVAFILLHCVAALTYSVAWILLNSAIESVLSAQLVLMVGVGLKPYITLGVWIYVMVAGVSYATVATERVARAEAAAAKAQLAALRAQLHPHFLFNALHSVVHLIPREPERAAHAAEQVGALLRTTIEEDRDLVTLHEEWAFVERYLDVERIRFGDRLHVQVDLSPAAREALVPSFSLLTLVENAVRHGVGSREEPTSIAVHAAIGNSLLTLLVHDNAAKAGVPGAAPDATADAGAAGSGAGSERNGTGLARLRERLDVLYGDRARLTLERHDRGGTVAMLVIPVEQGA